MNAVGVGCGEPIDLAAELLKLGVGPVINQVNRFVAGDRLIGVNVEFESANLIDILSRLGDFCFVLQFGSFGEQVLLLHHDDRFEIRVLKLVKGAGL